MKRNCETENIIVSVLQKFISSRCSFTSLDVSNYIKKHIDSNIKHLNVAKEIILNDGFMRVSKYVCDNVSITLTNGSSFTINLYRPEEVQKETYDAKHKYVEPLIVKENAGYMAASDHTHFHAKPVAGHMGCMPALDHTHHLCENLDVKQDAIEKLRDQLRQKKENNSVIVSAPKKEYVVYSLLSKLPCDNHDHVNTDFEDNRTLFGRIIGTPMGLETKTAPVNKAIETLRETLRTQKLEIKEKTVNYTNTITAEGRLEIPTELLKKLQFNNSDVCVFMNARSDVLGFTIWKKEDLDEDVLEDCKNNIIFETKVSNGRLRVPKTVFIKAELPHSCADMYDISQGQDSCIFVEWA